MYAAHARCIPDVFKANHTCGFNMYVKIRSPWGWWYIVSPQYSGSVLVKILKVSEHCLRIKTWYWLLLTRATFCQYVQLQPAINITIMPLSWAYGCQVKGTLGVLIEPGLQNCNIWLRNSIIYSTSYETDNRTPSTGWYHCHSRLHQYVPVISPFCIIAALALSKMFVPTIELRCLSRILSSITSSRGNQIWIIITQSFDWIPVWAMPVPQYLHL